MSIRAIDLFPVSDCDDRDVELVPDLIHYVIANDVRCFTALVVQLENDGLVDWASAAHHTSEFWTAYFEKWTAGCRGCKPIPPDYLGDLDWSI